MKTEYEYKCTQPMLPPAEIRTNPGSPIMDYCEMEWWLNAMAEEGWEFLSHGQTNWLNGLKQDWWIFRRLKKQNTKAKGKNE